jgi:hypothetical protein
VVAERCALFARGAASKGEAARMVAEKPFAFAKASAAAVVAATAAVLSQPLKPFVAWTGAGSAWTRSIAGAARANRSACHADGQ